MNIKTIYEAGESPGKKGRIQLLLGLILVFVVVLVLGRYQASVVDIMKSNLSWLQAQHETYPVLSGLLYVATYVATASFFLPVTLILSLLAGAVFGFTGGLVLVSISYLCAATSNFLLSRYFLREKVRVDYAPEIERIRDGLDRHGWFYLMVLRLIPMIPGPVINLVFGALPFPYRTFIWVSAIFTLPIIAFYVSVGTGLAQIDSLDSIFPFSTFN